MPSIGPTVDVRKLPEEIRTKLAQLDLELSEGDITEKGYEKKRRLLLEPFLKKAKQNGTTSNKKDAKDAKAQRHMRRTTRNESRYHSEIRQEAVQQALAEWGRGDESKPAAEEKDANPLAIRNSFRPIRRRHASTKLSQQDQSNSSSDDGEEQGSSTLDSGTGGSRDRQNGGNKNGKKERKKGKQSTKAAGEGESGAATKAAESIVDKSAGPSNEEQPSTSPPQQAAAGDDDSQRLKDDISLQKVQQNSSREKEKTTKIADDRVKKNMAGQEADVLQSKPEPSQQKDAAKPPNGQPRQSTSKEGEEEEPPQFAAKLRNLPSAVRRTMAAECPSTAANRTSVLVLEDRPLPALPPTDDEEDGPEPAVYVNSTNDSGLGGSTNGPQDYANSKIPAKQTRVSQKIHQVLLSLQKPRKKPLQEYYNDDDVELEAMANAVDPSAPQPSGQLITPCRGDFPGGNAPPALPRSIDSVLFKWANTQPKVVAAVQLDSAGKAVTNLTYAKLLSRASKIAYTLLNRQVTVSSPSGSKERVQLCLPGDRVALVYPNSEAPAFLCAFYGCLLAGVVPVPIEVPTAKRDAAGLQQFGFLLGSCGVRVALTTERCLKGLPRMQSSAQNSGVGLLSSPSAPAGFSASSTNPGAASNSIQIQPGQAGHQGNINDLADFKGWPRLHWLVTEGLGRPAREWTLPSLLAADDSMAYIEYSTDREGAVKGVTTSRQALLAHARALGAALEYKEGQTLICVVDFKREVGLWHACIAAVCHGMRVIFVPYSLMKVNPTCWLLQATRQQAQFALVKSRDLHWSLMAVRDHAQLQLNSLRAILVTDGANPWSLSSCDQFASTFKAHGLWPGVICPCAGSTEAGTVALRRPSRPETGQAQPSSNGPQNCGSGRGILSMLALSHCVVRVDQESSLSSLALQDTGQVVPGGMAVVVKLNGAPRLCRADEIGEICLHSTSAANGYHGLRGLSQTVFAVSPLGADDKPIGPLRYTRTGLVGFLGPEGLIFAVGNKQSLLHVSGRVHSADDLIATVLAVEPMKFIYRGRIAVFSGRVLRDERVCIVAEQMPEVNEEEAFGWMVRVLQAIDSIHQLGIYCLSLVPPNQLPKTPLGGIHVTETRQRFLEGCLHPSTLLMCPQNCVLNLPKPREPPAEVGPAAMFVGNIVQGVRIAGAQGRELQPSSPDESINLADILRQRAQHTPDHVLFSLLNSRAIEVDSLTCGQLLKRAERIAALLLEKGRLTAGDHVALIFPPGLDLIAAVFGCFCVSLVPVCIRPPSAQNLHTSMLTVRMIVDVSKAVALLSSSSLIKLLKSKEVSHRVNTKAWPTILDIEDAPSLSVARNRSRRSADSNAGGGAGTPTREPTDICYLDFAVSTTGQLSGVFVTTQGAANQCKSLKMACELYPSRNVTLCLDPYSGLGFSLWCLSSVFSGHQSSLIPPLEMEQNAQVWLQTLTQNKSRDTFCSYSVLEHCVRELAPQLGQLRERGVNLSSLRNCIVVAEERPRVQLCTAFIKLFAPLGLNARAVSTGFGCRVNSAICMQGAASPDPSSVYVDARALRNDRVTLVEKGAPHSICLMESGKLLPGVKVAIANPKTLGQCADTHLGEIWVASGHNAAGFFSLLGEETRLQTDHFNARLMTGDTKTIWARTGYLGFLRQTQAISADGELHDALFVVGSMDEMLLLRGMHYHPVDIELTVTRAHRQICESAAFTWTHLLVIVAETSAPETEALDLVPAITSAVLEEQQLIVGVVVVVDPGVIPMNSRGEKQRTHLRELFLKDQLDPIYVSYNL